MKSEQKKRRSEIMHLLTARAQRIIEKNNCRIDQAMNVYDAGFSSFYVEANDKQITQLVEKMNEYKDWKIYLTKYKHLTRFQVQPTTALNLFDSVIYNSISTQ